jgi:two-component sensor histidine kinase
LSEQTDAVNVEHLVRAQLAHFEGLIDARIAIDGPEMTIKGEVAQALGMAVHELATNAGKYGALSNESGRVDIRWGPIDPKGGKRRFEFKWIERDGPPVTPPTQTGFGSTVLGPMVQSAINGDVDLRYDPAGLTWHAIGTDTAISR